MKPRENGSLKLFLMQKPYKCEVVGCSKRYTDPSSLRKHVKGHSTEEQLQYRRAKDLANIAKRSNSPTSRYAHWMPSPQDGFGQVKAHTGGGTVQLYPSDPVVYPQHNSANSDSKLHLTSVGETLVLKIFFFRKT